MTSKKSYHIILVPEKDSWKVKKAGASRATKIFNKKADAIVFAKTISRKEKTALFIHRKDGTIEEMRSYIVEAVAI